MVKLDAVVRLDAVARLDAAARIDAVARRAVVRPWLWRCCGEAWCSGEA